MEEPAYHLDIDGLDVTDVDAADARRAFRGRPWLGIRFDCCNTYTRIYRNREGTAYRGFCPHCQRWVTVRVGPGGTDHRFFRAE